MSGGDPMPDIPRKWNDEQELVNTYLVMMRGDPLSLYAESIGRGHG